MVPRVSVIERFHCNKCPHSYDCILLIFAKVEHNNSFAEPLDLDSLLIRLKGKVTEKWYQFGVALGVEKETLDQCLKYPPEQSIVEALDHWLRSCDCEKQSWTDVARALRQIEYHQLAKEIESIDRTGHHSENCME